MILRKDYVNLIQSGKAQVKVDKTEQHNKMLNIIFPKRTWFNYLTMSVYFSYYDNYYDKYRGSDEPFKDLPIIEADDIILDNTVIKVESEEHGKKVIEWWKEQGVDTMKIGKFIGYYGLINGKFLFFSPPDFKLYIENNSVNIITLPEGNRKQEAMKKINWEQAQELIDMVSSSCEWKTRLVTLWANKIVLREEIEVSEELLQQGRNAASQSQKEVIDKIFGKEKEEIRFALNSNVYGLVIDRLAVISSFTNTTIKLNDNFNWTLKDNILTVSHRD